MVRPNTRANPDPQEPTEDPGENDIGDFEHIDARSATPEAISKYTEETIAAFEKAGFQDYFLRESVIDSFIDFEQEDFLKISRPVIRKLIQYLVTNGFWVNLKNGGNKSKAELLYEAISEGENHQWTKDDIEWVYLNLGEISGGCSAKHERLNVSPDQPSPNLRSRRTLRQADFPPEPRRDTSNTQRATGLSEHQQDSQFHDQPRNEAPMQRNVFNQEREYTREIVELTKMYREEDKYGGEDDGDSFRYKLNIFYDMCKRVNLPPSQYQKAFLLMLKGMAKDHYFSNRLTNTDFHQAVDAIGTFFEGAGFHQRALAKWNETNLQGIIDSNPEKPTHECIKLLITKLRSNKHALHPDLQTDSFFHAKLVSACSGVPACHAPVINPPPDIGSLMNVLQSAAMAYEQERKNVASSFLGDDTDNEAYYTDRHYRRNTPNTCGGGAYRGPQRRYNPDTYKKDGKQKSCWVCKGPNCRSWKHTPEEREAEKARYKSLLRTNSSTPGFSQFFEEHFHAYCEEQEGIDEDMGNFVKSFNTAFSAFTSDTDSAPTTSKTRVHFETGFNTSYFSATLPAESAESLTHELENMAFQHQLLQFDSTQEANEGVVDDVFHSGASRYTNDKFYGICIDTGAANRSTAGFAQFQALKRHINNLHIDKSTGGSVNVQFGIGKSSSIGSTAVSTPIGTVVFHVMPTNTPFLLSLADMDALGAHYNNIEDKLITPTTTVSVTRRFGHAWLLWGHNLEAFLCASFVTNPCFLTETELRRLHRRFGHPSVERLHTLLRNSNHDVEKKTIEHLTKYCAYCQKHGKSPGRFRFSLRDENIEFNYCIVVDVMYIHNKPLLHIVDQATTYQAGRWLENISAKHTWDVLRMIWIDTYQGPPDMITTDTGTNFTSKDFQHQASLMGIKIKIVPVEAHNSIGLVERYHGPLRRAYTIIKQEIPDLHKDMALQMSLKAINDTAGPNGLVPTLLVYGAYPRMVEADQPSPSIATRSAAIKKAMAEVKKAHAELQIRNALNQRNGPTATAIHDLPIGSDVLVFREGVGTASGFWSGPHKLIAMRGEDCFLDMGRDITSTFRSTSVKPYFTPESEDTEAANDNATTEASQTPETIHLDPEADDHATEKVFLPQTVIKRGKGRPKGSKNKKTSPANQNLSETERNDEPDVTCYLLDESFESDKLFKASRQLEVNGLLEKNVFETVKLDSILPNERIFGARFVDEIKHKGTDRAYEKSRLVVQAFNDADKTAVLTQSPTIQRASQRLLLCIAAVTAKSANLHLRDISQAYVQSQTKLNRDFYIKPPPELKDILGLDDDSVLKVVKPLYGVPEAGNHWYKTYHDHHTEKLGMIESTYDPCLLYRRDANELSMIGLQTDDTLILCNDSFAELEEVELQIAKFQAKKRETLAVGQPLKFNGGLIELTVDGTITLSQERLCKNLEQVSTSTKNVTNTRGSSKPLNVKEQYVAQRARGAYIASLSQPEMACALSLAAQAIDPDEADIKRLNDSIHWQQENAARGLRFVHLDINTLRLFAFTDASFANNKDYSSQIGYVIALADGSNRANVLSWSSIKCKRVTRSVLASELYAMSHGFDSGSVMKSTLEAALGTDIPLTICTDSKSLYDCLARLGTTTEKRLMVDILCLRQAYQRREIAEVRWISTATNPADCMTKQKGNGALRRLIDTSQLEVEVMEWVERGRIEEKE